MSRTFRALALLAGSLLLIGAAGCGGGSGGGSTGTLQVYLADAPGPGVTRVDMTVDKIDAHLDSDWVTVMSTPQTVNLLDLVTTDTLFASAKLPTGHYTQVRLFVSNATVTDATGTHSVTIPSAAQTGIKVNVDYSINANDITSVLLDFNVDKSIIKEGNGTYRMQPVIPAVVKVLSGTVTGTVTSGGTPFEGASVTATYTDGTNYPAGTVVNSATTLSDGTFKIWALLPGTYTITASYTDPSTSTTKTAVQTGVVVTAAQNTTVGPLALQ